VHQLGDRRVPNQLEELGSEYDFAARGAEVDTDSEPRSVDQGGVSPVGVQVFEEVVQAIQDPIAPSFPRPWP